MVRPDVNFLKISVSRQNVFDFNEFKNKIKQKTNKQTSNQKDQNRQTNRHKSLNARIRASEAKNVKSEELIHISTIFMIYI